MSPTSKTAGTHRAPRIFACGWRTASGTSCAGTMRRMCGRWRRSARPGSSRAFGMSTQCANQTSYRYNRRMDHHTVAAISIAGTCLDVLGSLYLAYDLLGGQHGPLRLLTRAVTYAIVFGIGYGLGLGLFFGLAAGIATGITLSVEFNRAARGLNHYSLSWEALISA